MDKKIQKYKNKNLAGKLFFLVFFLLIAGSIAMTYYRIMVKRDYIISAQVDCDPTTEACFIYECDPEDPEDPECATLPEEERISYYKIINKNAKNIPLCNSDEEECSEELSCEPGEEECEEELCDDSNVPEGESCNDPEQYLAENPPEECDCKEDGTEENESGEEENISEDSARSQEEVSLDEDEEETSCECDKDNAEEEEDNNVEESAPQPY